MLLFEEVAVIQKSHHIRCFFKTFDAPVPEIECLSFDRKMLKELGAAQEDRSETIIRGFSQSFDLWFYLLFFTNKKGT